MALLMPMDSMEASGWEYGYASIGVGGIGAVSWWPRYRHELWGCIAVVATSIRSGGAGGGVGHGSVWPSIPSTISTMALPPYAPHRHGVGMHRGMVYRWVGVDPRHGG